jgi:hypothetical protein
MVFLLLYCFVGAGVFAGYLGRNDLTKQVLCKINNEICYRTGDLARLNLNVHSFEYCGRRDYQVKLRGQRIELGEIESVIMETATMCIVNKITHMNNEYLVAYVETKSNEHDLRQHCSLRLPLYMVPSFFVILEKLPVNQNGKIDRKALPGIDFDSLSFSSKENEQLLTEMERRVFKLWCQVLPHLKSIPSISTSFFSLGGNSLSLMQLSRLYRQEFKQHHIQIIDLFGQSTLAAHVQLLQENRIQDVGISDQWYSLNMMNSEFNSISLNFFQGRKS